VLSYEKFSLAHEDSAAGPQAAAFTLPAFEHTMLFYPDFYVAIT